MTAAAVGLYRTEGHEYYWNGQGPFPGTTGALGIMDKPALAQWAKKETAKAAFRNLDTLARMADQSGEDEAVKWLATIPGYQRDTAAKLGSTVHLMAERIAHGETGELDADPTLGPFLDAYRQWQADYRPQYIGTELGVMSLTYGYGGTLDMLLRLGEWTYLVDIKTSKGVYKETALQLAAYGMADFVGYPGDRVQYELPAVDRYAVLHLRPDAGYSRGYRMLEFRVGDAERDAFLAALRLSQWARTAKPVGGYRQYIMGGQTMSNARYGAGRNAREVTDSPKAGSLWEDLEP